MSPAAPFSAWERYIAARYLRAKRSQGGVALISIISFVAISLAVAALIIVMSIMNGFRAELFDKIMGFNGHAFVVGGAMSADDRDALVTRLSRVPGVIAATPVVESQALAQGPNGAAGAVVRGLTPADVRSNRIIGRSIKAGSLKDFGNGEDGGDLIVIGQKLANSLGVAPGDPVSITSPSGGATAFGTLPIRKTYTVAATFEIGMSEYDQAFIYMPINQAQLFFGRESSVDFIEVRVADPDKVTAMKPALAHAAGPGSVVSDWTDKNRAFFGALQVERNAMRIILVIIILIAALNIISGLIMLVKNKSRDIAILRTMGATQGAVLRIFFMAGATIGVLGALCGLTFGLLFCANIEAIQNFVEWVTGTQVFNADVYFLAHVPAKIDWGEVALATALSVGASFIFTLPQAFHASRLDPVEALRYE